MTLAIVLALATPAIVLVIIDPKYGLFVLWRTWRNKKFTDDYDLLFNEWQRLHKEFKIWADRYKKRCNQSDCDNEQENFLQFMESMLVASADSLTVAYQSYPWRYPFFWKRSSIYGLLVQVDIILEICDKTQKVYKEKYIQK